MALSAPLLAAAVAIAALADPPADAGPARISVMVSVTVLAAGRAGERIGERDVWRSLRSEAGQRLTCFE